MKKTPKKNSKKLYRNVVNGFAIETESVLTGDNWEEVKDDADVHDNAGSDEPLETADGE